MIRILGINLVWRTQFGFWVEPLYLALNSVIALIHIWPHNCVMTRFYSPKKGFGMKSLYLTSRGWIWISVISLIHIWSIFSCSMSWQASFDTTSPVSGSRTPPPLHIRLIYIHNYKYKCKRKNTNTQLQIQILQPQFWLKAPPSLHISSTSGWYKFACSLINQHIWTRENSRKGDMALTPSQFENLQIFCTQSTSKQHNRIQKHVKNSNFATWHC